MVKVFKEESAKKLRGLQAVPQLHPVWNEDLFAKFKSTVNAVLSCISYIERNATNELGAIQKHDFVKPYQGEWSGRRS